MNFIKYIYSAFLFCSPKTYISEQVHLSLNENVLDMTVMWVRCPKVSNCKVFYGEKIFNLNQKVDSINFKFQTGFHYIYNYQVVIKNLKPDTQYFYKIDCNDNSSKIFNFKTLPSFSSKLIPTVVAIGDLGLYFSKSLNHLEKEVLNNKIDVLLHLGDIAYDMYLANGKIGDKYMQKLEKIASKIPYMVAPGNHEYMPIIGDSGKNYENRFKMPGPYKNQRYFFQVGKIMYIILNSEVYYSKKFNQNDIIEQESWFNHTMIEANKRRHIVPWIVVVIHRPLYCNAYGFGKCVNGINEKLRKQLENLFHLSGIDIGLYGHNHHYERMHPVYNKKVYGDKKLYLIKNPKTLIHIVNGAGGNQEGLNSFLDNPLEWSAVRIKENGYLKMQAFNYTHLNCKFYSTTSNKTKDNFWIYQQFHGPFSELN